MVAVSSSGGILWKQERGSVVGTASMQCGCCGGTSEVQQQFSHAATVQLLYIGCCEKGRTYLIYEKNSTAVNFEGGC